MSRQREREWIEARALLQRRGAEFLLLRPRDSTGGWEFPGGRVAGSESPEAALRRHCRASLGIELDLQRGQPPFQHDFDTHAITYRYYECTQRAGEPKADANVELRWIARGQLRDYEFDAATQQVVDWLLAAG